MGVEREARGPNAAPHSATLARPFPPRSDSHHVHHRVYVCLAAGTSHTVESGFTTVVNATKQSAASGKLTVSRPLPPGRPLAMRVPGARCERQRRHAGLPGAASAHLPPAAACRSPTLCPSGMSSASWLPTRARWASRGRPWRLWGWMRAPSSACPPPPPPWRPLAAWWRTRRAAWASPTQPPASW